MGLLPNSSLKLSFTVLRLRGRNKSLPTGDSAKGITENCTSQVFSAFEDFTPTFLFYSFSILRPPSSLWIRPRFPTCQKYAAPPKNRSIDLPIACTCPGCLHDGHGPPNLHEWGYRFRSPPPLSFRPRTDQALGRWRCVWSFIRRQEMGRGIASLS